MSVQAALNAPQDVLTCRKKTITAATKMLSKFPGRAAPEIPDCIPMTEAAFATVSSIFTLGGLVGALAAGPFCSSRGRLPAMRLTAIVYLIGSGIETIATSLPIMAVGRTLTGVGAGASTVIVPLYISEIAPPAERGFFGFFTQISVNVGILLTQTLGYFLSYGSAWRWILGTGVIIAAAQGTGLLVVPESPAWLACQKGEVLRGRRILQRIRGKDVSLDSEVAAWDGEDGASAVAPAEEQGLLGSEDALEVPTTPRSISGSKSSVRSVGFWQVLGDPLYRPAIIAVVGIMFAQQVSLKIDIVFSSLRMLTTAPALRCQLDHHVLSVSA